MDRQMDWGCFQTQNYNSLLSLYSCLPLSGLGPREKQRNEIKRQKKKSVSELFETVHPRQHKYGNSFVLHSELITLTLPPGLSWELNVSEYLEIAITVFILHTLPYFMIYCSWTTKDYGTLLEIESCNIQYMFLLHLCYY